MSGHGHDDEPAPVIRIDPEDKVTYFAMTNTRGKREPFGIRAIDRGKHMYVIGKTGMGKSTMLENMAIQDIQNGEGMCFIDPHGSTAEKLLDFVPYDRVKDVVYFAPFDTEYPVGFNVMEDVGYDKRHLVVSGLMGAFKRIWVDAWSARMEYILQNTLLALLEYPGSTLLDVNRMLTNKAFRADVVGQLQDPVVRAFWEVEFATYTDRYTQEATPAIQNKVGQFVSNPLIRNIVGQSKSSFDLRKMMDEKKIFIVNLSKGRMGESNASLLGSMLTVKIYLAAMSRADEPDVVMQRLPRFYFYVDEFQSMMNDAFADILSESRKYKLALTLANQYIEQMEEKVRDAVFGNVGSLVVFRVGPFDADVLKTVFEPTFLPEDLVELGLGSIYLTLMINGVGSPPFSASTLPPIDRPPVSYRDDVIQHTRSGFGRSRLEVEQAVNSRQSEFLPEKKKKPGNGNNNYGNNGNNNNNNGNQQRQAQPQQSQQQRSQPVQQSAPVATQPAVKPLQGTERNQLLAALDTAVKEVKAATPPPPASKPKEESKEERTPADILRAKMLAKKARQETVQPAPVIPPPPPPPPPIQKAVAPEQPMLHNAGNVSEPVAAGVTPDDLRRLLDSE